MKAIDKFRAIPKTEKTVAVTLFLLFLTQKISFHVAGMALPLALFIFPIFFVILLLRRRIAFNFRRAFVFFFFIIFIIFSTLINLSSFSIFSLLLLLFIYVFFIFDYKLQDNERNRVIGLSSKILFFFAIIGILQFVVQFIGLPFIDPFTWLPDSLRTLGFNNTYPIKYGSTIMKANGMIFLEPSFFSQFMAVGIIFELYNKHLSKKNFVRIIIYLLAIIASFSGTGIVVLVFAIIPYIFIKKVKNKVAFLFFFTFVLVLLLTSQYGSLVLSRVREIKIPTSSGAIRFVNPLVETFGKSNNSLLFGNGAGSVSKPDLFVLEVNFNAILKVCFEYGLLCAMFFLFLVLDYFFKNKFSLLSFSLIIMYLILSGNLLSPFLVFLIVLLLESDSKNCRVLITENTSNLRAQCI